MTDEELRRWCLERAFETRALKGVPHMAVTNVADEYYRWIKGGHLQALDMRVVSEDEYCSPPEPSDGLWRPVAGKYGITRDGDKVGPMMHWWNGLFVDQANQRLYRGDGVALAARNLDLISEWPSDAEARNEPSRIPRNSRGGRMTKDVVQPRWTPIHPKAWSKAGEEFHWSRELPDDGKPYIVICKDGSEMKAVYDWGDDAFVVDVTSRPELAKGAQQLHYADVAFWRSVE